MRRVVAAALTLGFAGSAFGESDFDEIQDEEQPGSEIGIKIGGGTISVERVAFSTVLVESSSVSIARLLSMTTLLAYSYAAPASLAGRWAPERSALRLWPPVHRIWSLLTGGRRYAMSDAIETVFRTRSAL